jgi:predicted TIM-barrel fold metal-dependent hydrolase
MLSRHPNLALSIRPFIKSQNALINPQGVVNQEWIQVFRDFPDRFVIGTDSFIVASNYSGPDAPKTFAMQAEKQRNAVQTFLDSLPEDLARRIGYENAERIYKLVQ